MFYFIKTYTGSTKIASALKRAVKISCTAKIIYTFLINAIRTLDESKNFKGSSSSITSL